MKHKYIPAVLGLTGALGVVGSASAVVPVCTATATSQTCTFTATNITNAVTNCAEGSLVNCAIAAIPKVTCPVGEEPSGVRVTIGPGAMRSSVSATNGATNPACLNIREVTHAAITVAVPDASKSVQGTPTQNGTFVNESIIDPWCTSSWAATPQPPSNQDLSERFRFYRAPSGTISAPDILVTPTAPSQSVTYDLTDPEFASFYGLGTFNAQVSGRAGVNSQTAGTWSGGVVTVADAQVSVQALCGEPPPPQLACEYKVMSPQRIGRPSAPAIATQFKIVNLDQENPVEFDILDTMHPKMSYVAGSGSVPDPTKSGNVYTWSGVDLGPGESIEVNYSVAVTGLADRERVCNSVIATAQGVTSTGNCTACVSYVTTDGSDGGNVPAMGAVGLGGLALGLAGLGVLFGFGRRR